MGNIAKKRFTGLSSAEKAVAAMYCATGFDMLETAKNLGRNKRFVASILSREKVSKQIDINMRKAMTKIQIDPAMVARRVAGMALTNITEVLDDDGDMLPLGEIPEMACHAIKSIKKTPTKFGETVTVELHSPDKALDTTMRWMNIAPAQEQEATSINVGIAVNNVSDSEINERIDAIAKGGRESVITIDEDDREPFEDVDMEDEEYDDLLD